MMRIIIIMLAVLIVGCAREPGQMARYTIQYKLVDGSWTEPETVVLEANGKIEVVVGGNAFESYYCVVHYGESSNTRLRVAAIDYRVLSVQPVRRTP